MAPKNPPGEPMTLGNMRHLGVHRLIASCLQDACRHQGLIDVPSPTHVGTRSETRSGISLETYPA